jgi:hypothetical protein
MFMAMCYKCKLTLQDLEIMTIGNCLDYIEEFLEQQKPIKERSRKATQTDFDNF